jgi:hypothetical protein
MHLFLSFVWHFYCSSWWKFRTPLSPTTITLSHNFSACLLRLCLNSTAFLNLSSPCSIEVTIHFLLWTPLSPSIYFDIVLQAQISPWLDYNATFERDQDWSILLMFPSPHVSSFSGTVAEYKDWACGCNLRRRGCWTGPVDCHHLCN